MKRSLIFVFALWVIAWPLCASALEGGCDTYNFSKIDRQQGLSNSAVICIFKDDSGLMWFGTYDGVNCYDGREIETFRADFSKSRTLDNNVIYGIDQADGDHLWISTLLGVNRFSRESRQVVENYSVANGFHLCSNGRGDTWIVGYDTLSYYNTSEKRFIGLSGPEFTVGAPSQRSFVADDGELWLFPDSDSGGELIRISLSDYGSEESSARFGISTSRFHPRRIESVFYQDNAFCFIDSDRDLYMYDIGRQAKIRIRHIGNLLRKYGPITGVVPFYDDFIIAFRTNGLMRLKTAESYGEEIVDQNLRVFDLYKDQTQGILWIGVDGKGAMMYTKRHSIATNIMMQNLSPNFTRQVRSIMTDAYGGLWFGTKGDGLIHIEDYDKGFEPGKVEVFFPEKRQTAHEYTRENTEFPVFTLRQSDYMDGFWVGSGSAGLFYYDFGKERLCRPSNPGRQNLDEIHEIYEANDTTLYVATAGTGFCRLTLDKQEGKIAVKKIKRYRFFHEQQEVATFFAMVPEGDSLLWLGSREKGLIRFNMNTEEYRVISLKEMLGRSVDDVLCICRSTNGDMFVGTTAGLVRLMFEGKRIEAHYAGREQGLLNDMIHGILEDDYGFLWLSTNKGLIKYNPANGSSHAYYYSGGVHIGEFSDDAYYKCPYTGYLFFGGIDGLLYVDKVTSDGYEHNPRILLRKLAFGRNEMNLADFLSEDGSTLRFKYMDDTFTLTFVVPDFISAADIEYSWMLEGYDKDWQPFKVSNEVYYTGVPPGNYILHIRYRKDIFDTAFQTFAIPVEITPLWYQTIAVRILFAAIVVSLFLYVMFVLHRSIRHKRLVGKLSESESKSNTAIGTGFHNNEIVHRLTSIYSACGYLSAENTAYEERCSKIDFIRENVMSLLLPTDIFEDPAGKKFSPVRFTIAGRLCLKAVSDEVMAILEKKGYITDNINVEIPDTLTFPVYKNAFKCFLYYIYLFASVLKRSKSFSVSIAEEDGMLTMIFGSSKSTVHRLYASFTDKNFVHSVPSNEPDAVFGIRLLHRFVLTMMDQLEPVIAFAASANEAELSLSFRPAVAEEPGSDKKTVLMLEDKDEMYWLVGDILSVEYIVHRVTSIHDALEFLKHSPPAVFMVDMLLYADAADSFMEFVGRNGSLLMKTAFIPMLTWEVSASIQRELILLSDSFIVLPYDIIFLKEIVHKAVYGRKEAKRIYIEDLGDFANFITCTTQEHVEFIRKMVTVIEDNIDREDLGSRFIAEQMAMSPRKFYRKFKELSGLPPTELIKKYRMEKAAMLLLDDELSIQDVIVEVGISSRSYFYKEFTRKYGMTPKEYRDLHNSKPIL